MHRQLKQKMRHQLAHILFSYGDEPELLTPKLENMLSDWYFNGFRDGVDYERRKHWGLDTK